MSSARKLVIASIALVLVGSACNSRLIRPPAIVFADAANHIVSTTIEVGDDNRVFRFPSVFNAFLPSEVPLHAGDAVNFQVRDSGEPHTLAMGRLVNEAVSEIERLGPTAELDDIEKTKQMRKLPTLFPTVASAEVPKLNLSAAKRCILQDGEPPVSEEGGAPECDDVGQPDFDGTHAFYSAGVLEDGEPFRVKLSGDIAPGTYAFMCLMHRSQMTGNIEVRPDDVARPAVAELRTAAEEEQDSIDSTLEPTAKAAQTAVNRVEGTPFFAGTGPEGITRGMIDAFIPRDGEAKVSEPVTWRFYGTHSISFKPSREAKEGLLLLEGDKAEVNANAWSPVGSPALPKDLFAYPPTKKKTFKLDGGSYDGEGEFSSGVIPQEQPRVVQYTLRFTEEGTYSYTCLIHSSMRGKVDVSA